MRRSRVILLFTSFVATVLSVVQLSSCGGSSSSKGGTFTVGGTVTGLAGSLVISNNATDDLTLAADGPFTFALGLESGKSYDVKVKEQPTGQACSVTNGQGQTAAENITNITIACETASYVVGGSVTGLEGTVVLQNNSGDDLTISEAGDFQFATALSLGESYLVTVKSQPDGQSCSVAGATGEIEADVSTVLVSCQASYSIGGTVTGLSGTLVLRNNGGDDLTVTANGNFVFAGKLSDGDDYQVTVATQPSGQVCSVSSGSGEVSALNVTNIQVVCAANSYAIGGTVSGLVGTVILRNNSGDDLTISADGSFEFATEVAKGAAYTVTVASHPTGQSCSLANATGTVAGAVSNVTVTCAYNMHTIGGTVSGLSGTVVLRNNGGDDKSVSANGSYSFATTVAFNSAYSVTIHTQPTGQTCTVTNGSGTASGNVTNIAISCSMNTYTIGGSVTGLTATVVLQNNGGDDLSRTTNDGFTFATVVAHQSAYAVTVLTQPTLQRCEITNGSGTVNAANVTNVTVACEPLRLWMYPSANYAVGHSLGNRATTTNTCESTHTSNYDTLPCTQFAALLGYSADNGVQDMPTNYGVPTNLPVVGPTKTAIADDWADLIGMTTGVQSTLSTAGVLVGGASYHRAHTGFQPGGAVDDNCNDWTTGGINQTMMYSGSQTWNSERGSCDHQFIVIMCMCWE